METVNHFLAPMDTTMTRHLIHVSFAKGVSHAQTKESVMGHLLLVIHHARHVDLQHPLVPPVIPMCGSRLLVCLNVILGTSLSMIIATLCLITV